jgi:hypothetical protein
MEGGKMSKDNKYKIAIVPSTEDEFLFRGIDSIRKAKALKRKLDKEGEVCCSLSIFGFRTRSLRDAFIEGYEAGVGWVGEGFYILEER